MSIIKAWRRTKTKSAQWFGDEDEGGLIELGSGRVLGHYWHDGYGKWDIRVCLTYGRAWRTIRRQPAGWAGFAAFPYGWVWLFRAKSFEDALSEIAELAGLVIIERDDPDD